MKQCSACKAWNRPESVYCAECGAPLPAEREKQEPFYVKVKRICGSPVFLVAILLYTVSVLIATITAVYETAAVSVTAQIDQVLYWVSLLGMQDLVNWLVEESASIAVGVTIVRFVTLLPSVLAAAGFWMFYAACRKKGDDPVRSSGLSFVKVAPILALVGVCLLLLVEVVALFGAFVLLGVGGEQAAVVLAVVLVMLAVTILMLIYYIGLIRTLSVVRAASSTGRRSGQISMYVVVWNFVLAAGTLLSNALLLIQNSILMTSSGIIDLLQGVLTAAFYILVSVVLLQYRSKVELDAFAQPSVPVVPIPQYPAQRPYPQQNYGVYQTQPIYQQNAAQPVSNGYARQNAAQPALNGYTQQNAAQPASNGYAQQSAAQPASNGYAQQSAAQPALNGYTQQNAAQPALNGYAQQNAAQPALNGYTQQNTAQPALNGYAQQNAAQPALNGYARQNTARPVSNGYAQQSAAQPVSNGYAQQNTAQPVSNGYARQNAAQPASNGYAQQSAPQNGPYQPYPSEPNQDDDGMFHE